MTELIAVGGGEERRCYALRYRRCDRPAVLSQISGVDGSSGMAANFALRLGGLRDPE